MAQLQLTNDRIAIQGLGGENGGGIGYTPQPYGWSDELGYGNDTWTTDWIDVAAYNSLDVWFQVDQEYYKSQYANSYTIIDQIRFHFRAKIEPEWAEDNDSESFHQQHPLHISDSILLDAGALETVNNNYTPIVQPFLVESGFTNFSESYRWKPTISVVHMRCACPGAWWRAGFAIIEPDPYNIPAGAMRVQVLRRVEALNLQHRSVHDIITNTPV